MIDTLILERMRWCKERNRRFLRYRLLVMEYFELKSGDKIPALSYGVCLVEKAECERCVLDALEVGYRAIDTAQAYNNENEVGRAVLSSGIPRNEMFITVKIDTAEYGYEKCRSSFLRSLEALRTDHVELCLLHQPFSDVYSSYRALEALHDEGLISNIGLSNFYADRMVDIYNFANVKPVLNQLELHPFHQRNDQKQWNDKYGIRIQAWSPFARGRNNMLSCETLVAIAEKHGKSSAQVVLRWIFQRGIASAAKSENKARMAQNIDIFDFSLDDEEMEAICKLDQATSAFYSHADPSTVEAVWQSIAQKHRV